MVCCWKEIPSKRPTFAQLIDDLELILTDIVSSSNLHHVVKLKIIARFYAL